MFTSVRQLRWTFSLIAMATLYILDWHKRNYGDREYYERIKTDLPPTTMSTLNGPGVGEIMIDKKGNTVSPPFDRLPDWVKNNPPPQLHPSCLSFDCQQYCCANRYSYGGVGSNGLVDNLEMVLQTQPPLLESDFNRKEEKAARIALDTDVFQDAKNGARKKRKIQKMEIRSKESLASGVGEAKIQIIDFNVTLDDQYCYGKQCNSKKEGNFTFYVPVSIYMPHIPLDIQFQVENKMLVEFCSTQATEHCVDVKTKFAYPTRSGPDTPDGDVVEERNTNLFKLPVGLFEKSAYRFRVGFSKTSCADPPDLAGQNYKEYNLVFYRVCSG